MTNTPKTLSDLLPDRKNRRKHTARNVEMLQESLEKVGTGRSIVIDENNEVLAGNATIKAAANIGLSKVRVIEVDGTEIVAVRRTGLSDQQKRALALYDNRVAEFAEWDVEQLTQDLEEGYDLSSIFYEDEITALIDSSFDVEVPLAERLGDRDESFVAFKCGDLSGRISTRVYESFVRVYREQEAIQDVVVLDDVLTTWLGLTV